MSYRVFWHPHAEQQFETILTSTANDVAFSNAAKEIDARLASDPMTYGESRYDTVRIGFCRPLGIHYEVLQDVETVIVYDVWRTDRRRR